MKKKKMPIAPDSLSKDAGKMWNELVAQRDIFEYEGRQFVLKQSLEAYDLCREAMDAVREDGLLITDRWGQKKSHPMLPVIRDSRSQFLQGMKMLGLTGSSFKSIKNPLL